MGIYDDEDGTTVFQVVVNHEEQYSLWPAEFDIPGGWRDAGKQGSKAECMEYVNEVWTDMRPKSYRDWLAEQEAADTVS